MVHGRPHIEFGLHVRDVGETEIHGVGLEEWLRVQIVGAKCRAPQVVDTGTSVQDGLQLLIGPEAMENGQDHHSSLNDAEAMEKRQGRSHGERSQNVDDENHRMKGLQMGLSLRRSCGAFKLVMLMAAVIARRRLSTS